MTIVKKRGRPNEQDRCCKKVRINFLTDWENTPLYKNFKEGDLLYGLHSVRKKILPVLDKKDFLYYTIDKINNKILYYYQQAPQDYTSLTEEERQWIKYFHTHKEPKWLKTILDHDNKYDDEDDKKIRRACALAIVNPAITIHFCLDDFDYDQNQRKTGKGIPFTWTELKIAYELYQRQGNESYSIMFYEKGHPVQPPWLNPQLKSKIAAMFTYPSPQQHKLSSPQIESNENMDTQRRPTAKRKLF